tara:strand:+ start:194 stop:439 length:246 start_codon:yes stop_codon:yes gene_type:complete
MTNEELNEELNAACVDKRRLDIIASTGAKLSKDGNQWCWLLGENLQVGIAGFGDTAYEAMYAFCSAFCCETIPENKKDNHE